MKTKRFFASIMLIVSICCTSKVSATIHYANLDTTTVSEWYSICGGPNDSLVAYKPSNALTGIVWFAPSGMPVYIGQDSVIITYADQGEWIFASNEISKHFYVYIISSQPYEPTCMVNDTNFCNPTFSYQLDAENTETGATYIWDDGSTNRLRTVTTVGIFWVDITNGCGTRRDSVIVTQTNPNAPHLGPDTTVCYGTTILLDPGSVNVVLYTWSTGDHTPTLTVDTTGTYAVFVNDVNGCWGVDTINITTTLQPDIEMCNVTFDTLTNKNSINWYVDPLETDIEFIIIWVKNNMGVFIALDTVPYSDGSYIHWGSNPQADYNEYYITAIGSCGEGNASAIHRSIWLTTLTNELQWQNYVGNFTPLYYIVFARMNDNSIVPIDTVPACSTPGCINHSAIVANPNVVKYFVAFEHTCDGSKSNGWVRSNYLDITTSVQEIYSIDFSIYPNPVSDKLNISISLNNFQVEVLTMLGQVLLHEHNTKVLNISKLPQGTYIISIIADGRRSNRIFTKN